MTTIIKNDATVQYTISGTTTTETSNEVSLSLENGANIGVSKSANPTTFSVGDIITYSVVITNTGSNYLNGVRVIDNLGGGYLAYVIGSGSLNTGTQTYAVNPVAINPLTFTLQQLAVGASMTLTYRAQVVFNLPSTVSAITNSVQAIGYTSSTSYSAYTSSTIQKKNSSAFSITKSASETTVLPNQIFDFIIALQNSGSEIASVNYISDALPTNFVITSVLLTIGGGSTTTLSSSDYDIGLPNIITVPSATGPVISVPAGGTTTLVIRGYLT